MDKRQVVSIARQYKQAVVNAIGPAKACLFRPFNKGRDHPDSDTGITVVVPQVNRDYLSTAASFWRINTDANTLIGPALIVGSRPSPSYKDIHIPFAMTQNYLVQFIRG